jgi:hypothetical protein
LLVTRTTRGAVAARLEGPLVRAADLHLDASDIATIEGKN